MCVYQCVSVPVCVYASYYFYFCTGSDFQPAISDMDSTEMFLIRSATINMTNVSDDGSEEIDIDYTIQQQLRAMNVTTDGEINTVVSRASIIIHFLLCAICRDIN